MLLSIQVSLESGLFQLVNISQLLNLFLLDSFNLNSSLLLHLNVLPVGNVVIMENVDISHSLGLQVSVKFISPFVQESIAGYQQLVGFFLGLKLCLKKLAFKLMGGFVVSDLAFKFMNLRLELHADLLEIRDLIVESILLISVGILQLFQLFSVDLSESVDFFEQMSDLPILQNNLSSEDFIL
jgi:hypothetical protein